MYHISKIYIFSFSLFLLLFSVAMPIGTPATTISNAPVYKTEINPQFINNSTSFFYSIESKVQHIVVQISEIAQKKMTLENYEFSKEFIKKFLWHYRYKITSGALLGSYGITALLLMSDYNYLTDATRWLRWKSEYTFEVLCGMSQAELAQQLLRSIGECNYNKKNPTDLAHPLITFINAIEDEIKTCKRYISITKIIKKLHLIKIMPTNETKIAEVSQFLERALFIRHIFLSWLAERNLNAKSLKSLIYTDPRYLYKKLLGTYEGYKPHFLIDSVNDSYKLPTERKFDRANVRRVPNNFCTTESSMNDL